MNPLEKKVLGSTGLEVTRLGLGCASLGRLEGEDAQEQATRVVHRALSLGVNLFDTAPLYGAGKSEKRLGKALEGVPRDDYVLASKVGHLVRSPEEMESIPADQTRRPIYKEYSYDGIMRSFEESLKRLGVDRIDILHIHDSDRHWDEAIRGAYPALDKLRSEGVIKGVSAGMNQ